MRQVLLVLILCGWFFEAKSQQHTSKGKEFYLAFMENLDLAFNGPPIFTFMISAEHATQGTISFPGTGYSQSFSLYAGELIEPQLPTGIAYPQGDEDISNLGIKITADDSINVYAIHYRLYFSDASLVLPTSELGDFYRVITKADEAGLSPAELVVEATQDNTQIEITPSEVTVSFRPAGIPFYITLNEGEVFQLQGFNGLTGTTIRSTDPNKKIAVFSGARQANVYCTGADSHLWDEDYPVALWGNDFGLVSFRGQGGDPFRFLAAYDNTTIEFGSHTKTLSAGIWYDTLFDGAKIIHSSNKIMVAQFDKSHACNASINGDPCMLILTPLSYLRYKAIFSTSNSFPDFSDFVNIIIPKASFSTIMLDSDHISSIFDTIPGNSEYLYAKLNIVEQRHVLESSGGFNAFAYGFKFYDEYAYHLGYDFAPGNVGIGDIPNGQSNGLTVNVYPDPASGSFLFSVSGDDRYSGKYELSVYDVLGKQINSFSFSGKKTTFQLPDVNGIYFYALKKNALIAASGKILNEK
ncbi:MAG TPA: T9SS type A sorting domain-containing protein [Chitinophagales bacterium]|nr:T9SS type A sorting domain-containing protein [Chitinophagales bacterium]